MQPYECRRRSGVREARTLVALLAAVVALAGCGSLPQLGGDQAKPRTTESATPAAQGQKSAVLAQEEQVYYVAEAGLNVYAEPSARAQRVAELPLYERVLRSDLQRGYARIRTADDRVHGWVDNARLIWRLPSDEARPQPAIEEPVAPAPEAETPMGEPGGALQPPVDVPDSGPVEAPQAEATQAPAPEAAGEQSAVPSAAEPAVETETKPEPSVFNPF